MGHENRDWSRGDGDPASPFGGRGGGIVQWIFNGRVYLYTAFDIRVLVHSTLILFIAFELLLNWRAGYGWQDKVAYLAILFVSVLVHEYGHCFAARNVGGRADEILLWPLGGLAYTDPPRRPWPTFVTVAFGPITTLGICVLSLGVLAFTLNDWTIGWLNLLNPFRFVLPVGIEIGYLQPTFLAWYVFKINALLFLFNLLPIFPMDGGRIVQTILWPRVGFDRSMLFATKTGMVGCVGLGLLGLISFNFLLILLGVMFFLNNRAMHQYVKAQIAYGGTAEEDEPAWKASLRDEEPTWLERRREAKEQRRAEKGEAARQAEQEAIDHVLARVSEVGMHNLTKRERKILADATARQQRGR